MSDEVLIDIYLIGLPVAFAWCLWAQSTYRLTGPRTAPEWAIAAAFAAFFAAIWPYFGPMIALVILGDRLARRIYRHLPRLRAGGRTLNPKVSGDLAHTGGVALEGDLVGRVARALFELRGKTRAANDAALAKDGLWPDSRHQPTDEEYARAAIIATLEVIRENETMIQGVESEISDWDRRYDGAETIARCAIEAAVDALLHQLTETGEVRKGYEIAP